MVFGSYPLGLLVAGGAGGLARGLGAATGTGAGAGAGVVSGAAVSTGAGAAAVSTGAGVAAAGVATVTGIVGGGIVSTTIWGCGGAAGGSVVAGTAAGGRVEVGLGATEAGWLAAAITVVSPNTAEAVIPLARMRAPIAGCGRRVRPVGSGTGFGGWNADGVGAGSSACGPPMGVCPRLARTAAIRAARSWSVIVRHRVSVVAALLVATARRCGRG